MTRHIPLFISRHYFAEERRVRRSRCSCSGKPHHVFLLGGHFVVLVSRTMMVVCCLCDGRVRIVMSPQELDICHPVKNTRFSVFVFFLGVHKNPVHPFHSGCVCRLPTKLKCIRLPACECLHRTDTKSRLRFTLHPLVLPSHVGSVPSR